MAHTEPEASDVEPATVSLKAAHADMPSHQSPALALQTSLEQSWQTRHADDIAPAAKIPFGWTLIGMSVVCAAFWYVLLHLVF